MKRRWFYRRCALYTLIVCMTWWVFSFYWTTGFVLQARSQGLDLEISRGGFYCIQTSGAPFSGLVRWHYGSPAAEVGRPFKGISYRGVLFEFAGFIFARGRMLYDPTNMRIELAVPLWFLTAVAALVTIWVWRKTSWRNLSRAFPVEMRPQVSALPAR